MGRSPTNSSPESVLDIKVAPRHTDLHHHHHVPPPPPPRKDHNNQHKKWIPWLVPTIVIVNVSLFVLEMYENNCPQNYDDCIGVSEFGRFAFQSTHENPLLGPSASTLLNMGALEVQRVVQRRQIWRLVTCMFLHAGVFHVLANMLSLIFVGIRMEQEFGFVRIGLLYVASGIGGSLLSCLFVKTTISVGASGALFGLLGAMLSELLVNWTIYEGKLETLSTLVLIILINMAVGILPHVDNFAHLGGFISGFLLGFVLLIRPQFGYNNNYWANQSLSYQVKRPPRKPKYKVYQYVFLVLSLTLLIIGFTVGLILLMRGVDGNDHCSWCHYLSCVPTPFWSCAEEAAQCMSSQSGDELNLTCMQNQRSKFYILDNNRSNTTAQIQKLCAELCST